MAAFASCFSHVPNACVTGTYNPQTVVSHYLMINGFQQEFDSIDDDPGMTDTRQCVIDCSNDFYSNVGDCFAASPYPPAGSQVSPQQACIQSAEAALGACMDTCW